MCKVRLALIVSFLCSVLSAALPPDERLERGSASEGPAGAYVENFDQSDDNPSAPAGDGNSDLGEQIILQRQSRRAPVHFRANTFLYWSNNVGSVSTDEDDGWFYGGSLVASWKQPLQKNLFFDAYAYQDAYFYDSSGLDFQSSELGVGLIGNVPFIEGLTVYGRYEFLHVRADNPLFGTDSPDEHLDSRYHRLRVGGSKALYSKPSHRVTFSTNARWDFDANSGSQRRKQISGSLAYIWAATGRLRVSSYYGLTYQDYLDSEQADWNQYVGLELSYKLNDWAHVSGSMLYGVNDSNTADSDYEALQGGLALSLHASF